MDSISMIWNWGYAIMWDRGVTVDAVEKYSKHLISHVQIIHAQLYA
jgi:hypothetical protein